jgi:hypothetical protein
MFLNPKASKKRMIIRGEKKPFYQDKLFPLMVISMFIAGMLAYLLFVPSNRKIIYPSSLLTFQQGSTPVHPTITPSVLVRPGVLRSRPAVKFIKSVAPLPTAKPTQVVDTGINWNTYSNSAYGYSLVYPPNWTVENLGELEPLVPSYVVFNPVSATASARTITVSVSLRSYQQQLSISGGSPEQSPVTIDSITGTSQTLADSDGNITISVILPLTNSLIVLDGSNDYQAIFNTMLSTLKFTQ